MMRNSVFNSDTYKHIISFMAEIYKQYVDFITAGAVA